VSFNDWFHWTVITIEISGLALLILFPIRTKKEREQWPTTK